MVSAPYPTSIDHTLGVASLGTSTQQTTFIYHDGGRLEAGYKGYVGDCVVRAITIATGSNYQETYDLVNVFCRRERRVGASRSSARNGVYASTVRRIMTHLGWTWIPTMRVGSGCQIHLRADELPSGSLVVRVSKHFTAVLDGIIFDTQDPSRNGTRCVYGYYQQLADTEGVNHGHRNYRN